MVGDVVSQAVRYWRENITIRYLTVLTVQMQLKLMQATHIFHCTLSKLSLELLTTPNFIGLVYTATYHMVI